MTTWSLTFTDRFDYHSSRELTLPLTLSTDADKRVLLRPRLDTGSTFCVFQSRFAALLDLTLHHGAQERIRTATGTFVAYGHEVTVSVGQLEWQAIVYFAANEDFPINVVGRLGFLDRLKVGLVDYEELLFVGAYEEPVG